MIVRDQGDVRGRDFVADFFGSESFFVGAERVAEVAEIFASAGVVVGADFALDSDEGVKLGGAAPGS